MSTSLTPTANDLMLLADQLASKVEMAVLGLKLSDYEYQGI